jgi:CHASE1-domain containing sensor protein
VLTPTSLKTAPRLTLLLLCSVLVIGLSASWIASSQVAKAYQTEAELRFGRLSDRLTAEVQRRVRLPVYGMNGARGVYAASISVERHEFAAYVKSRDLRNEFPGVQSMGFIERVPRDQLAAFITSARAENTPDFTVRTSGDAPDLFIIKSQPSHSGG